MYNQKVILPEQLPVKQKERRSTDVFCTIIGAVLALGMFITACVLWNKDSFNALYTGGASTTSESDCLGFKQTLLFTFIITIGWGLLRMTLTHCLPRFMPIISYVSAILFLIFFAIFSLASEYVTKSLHGWTIPFAIALIIIAVILTVMLCIYINEVKFQGYMLEYAVKFLNQNPNTFLYVPVYILFHIGLVALIVWQHCCFSSFYKGGNNFWNFVSSGVFDVFNILEYFWALQFLKDSFNFCVSGNAVDWYWSRQSSCYQSYQRLVCKNWGSVVGGSFLNAFLQVPTLIIELLVCHPNTCCSAAGTLCYNSCNFLTCFFELIRTDSYAYINLTGVPFCDASRQVARLCDHSNQFVGYHSAMKHFRFAAHIAATSFVFFWAFWILNYRTSHYDLWQVAILILSIYGNITWFVGIHTDAAQGLQTSYLAELELQGEHQYMQKILPSMRKILQPHQNRTLADGNC